MGWCLEMATETDFSVPTRPPNQASSALSLVNHRHQPCNMLLKTAECA